MTFSSQFRFHCDLQFFLSSFSLWFSFCDSHSVTLGSFSVLRFILFRSLRFFIKLDYSLIAMNRFFEWWCSLGASIICDRTGSLNWPALQFLNWFRRILEWEKSFFELPFECSWTFSFRGGWQKWKRPWSHNWVALMKLVNCFRELESCFVERAGELTGT